MSDYPRPRAPRPPDRFLNRTLTVPYWQVIPFAIWTNAGWLPSGELRGTAVLVALGMFVYGFGNRGGRR